MSQTDQIHQHLIDGKSLTPLDSLRLYGVFRLSGRILELRRMGLPIETELVKDGRKRYACYSLKKLDNAQK